MPTSPQDKLALAEAMVKRAKADGTPLPAALREYEDTDLAEAMAFAEGPKKDLFQRADAAEEAKAEQARLDSALPPLQRNADGYLRFLSDELSRRGLKSPAEIDRVLSLARSGVVTLEPTMQHALTELDKTQAARQANNERYNTLEKREPARASEFRGAAFASMADPMFGGMPTE